MVVKRSSPAWGLREKRRKQKRLDPSWRPYWIFSDSKKKDRARDHSFDLDIPFVRDLINNGCLYCGETELQMTLDRKDNTKGHTRENVVPACVRCNFMRRDMPWAAWISLVAAVRLARQDGLFGDWLGMGKRKV